MLLLYLVVLQFALRLCLPDCFIACCLGFVIGV